MLRLDHQAATSIESDRTAAAPDTAIPANPLQAPDAGTAAELVTAMRALKEWTGLTYRQLQRRAADNDAVLPHSTIAAVLARTTLPREDLLATFVRACGGEDSAVEAWLTVRRQIAVAATQPRLESTEPKPQQAGPEPEQAALADGGQQPDPAVPVEARQQPDPQPLPLPAAEPDRGPVAHPGSAPDRDPDPPIARPVPGVDSLGPAIEAADDARQPALRSATEHESSTLASAAAEQRQWRWRGIHRHDPADEVPRPRGLRWLIPPIMYRTGWAARVLSGVLVLLLVLVAVAFIARMVRDRGDDQNSPDPVPSSEVAETEDADPQPKPSRLPPTNRPKPARTTTTTPPVQEQPSANAPLAPAPPTERSNATPKGSRHPEPGSGGTTYECDTNGCNPFTRTPSTRQPTPASTECLPPCYVITTGGP